MHDLRRSLELPRRHWLTTGERLLSHGEVDPVLIIPAAGAGSRLQTSTPKFLVPVKGRPMIDRLVDLYRPYVSRIVLVVNPTVAADARQRFARCDVPVGVELQTQPTGMLDAVLAAYDVVLQSAASRVWVTWCDQVAIDPRTIARLWELSRVRGAASIVMPTVLRPTPYIHFQRDSGGRITKVLQLREGDAMPDSGESDAGLFSFSREAFLTKLPEYASSIETGSTTNERNLLPFIPWMSARGDVLVFPCVDEREAVGINTPDDMSVVEAYLGTRQTRVLSIVIPAYNEERFIGTLLERIKGIDLSPLGVDKEIIVVDDCSRDRTAAIVEQEAGVVLVRLLKNSGKGSAVRSGIARATGDYLIIQDADLEYDPNDYVPMLRALLGGRGDIVYGSRYLGRGKHANQSWAAYLGGRSLTLVAWLCTGRYLTDTVTAYKLFERADLAAMALETSGFELDHEITARMAARGKRIVEVPISYAPRSKAEGKKIGLHDWFVAIRTFWRYRRSA